MQMMQIIIDTKNSKIFNAHNLNWPVPYPLIEMNK